MSDISKQVAKRVSSVKIDIVSHTFGSVDGKFILRALKQQ